MVNTKQLLEEAKELSEAFGGTVEEQYFKLRQQEVGRKTSKTRSKSSKKTSINGAEIELSDVETTEEDGFATFKHKNYKAGKRGGYAIADLRTAKAEIELKGEDAFLNNGKVEQNAKTGTRFVRVDGHPIGENLVRYAENANLI